MIPATQRTPDVGEASWFASDVFWSATVLFAALPTKVPLIMISSSWVYPEGSGALVAALEK